MGSELTKDDIAEYQVEVIANDMGTQMRPVSAAYVATEDGKPDGWLVFKDHQHRVVAQFNQRLVVSVTRG